MAGRRRDKGKAPAGTSRTTHNESWDPNFRPADTDNSLFRETPYPIVPVPQATTPAVRLTHDPPVAPQIDTADGSETQDYTTQPPEGFGVDLSGAGGSNIHEIEKIYIKSRGNEFSAKIVAARRISKIISMKFTGPWRSYRAAPAEVKDLWFSEFELEFTWDERVRHEIRRIFDHVGSNVLKNRLYEAKRTNQRPGWITSNVWAGLQSAWAQQEYKKMSDRNKKNRASDCDGKGFPMHTGRSISHKTLVDRLRGKEGREPTVPERFLHTHSRMNAQGERVWADKRSRNKYAKYVKTFETPSSDTGSNSTPTPIATQLERWTELAGSSKKGKVYGLGGLTDSHSSYTAGYTSSTRERERELENEVRGLKESMQQMRDSQSAEIAALRAHVVGMNELRAQIAGMDELRAQVALLTSSMKAQQIPNIPFLNTRRARTLSTPQPLEGTQHVPTPFYPPRPIDNADTEDDD